MESIGMIERMLFASCMGWELSGLMNLLLTNFGCCEDSVVQSTS